VITSTLAAGLRVHVEVDLRRAPFRSGMRFRWPTVLQLTLQGTKYYKDDDLNDKSLLPTARRETAGL